MPVTRGSPAKETIGANALASDVASVMARFEAARAMSKPSGTEKTATISTLTISVRMVKDRRTSYSPGGGTSFTPTPRTLCKKRGLSADSPSLRRSHEICTSTVLSVVKNG